MNLDEQTLRLLGVGDNVIKKRKSIIEKSHGVKKKSFTRLSFWISFYFIEIFYFNFLATLLSWMLNLGYKGTLIMLGFSICIYWIISGKRDILGYISSKKEDEYERSQKLDSKE